MMLGTASDGVSTPLSDGAWLDPAGATGAARGGCTGAPPPASSGGSGASPGSSTAAGVGRAAGRGSRVAVGCAVTAGRSAAGGGSATVGGTGVLVGWATVGSTVGGATVGSAAGNVVVPGRSTGGRTMTCSPYVRRATGSGGVRLPTLPTRRYAVVAPALAGRQRSTRLFHAPGAASSLPPSGGRRSRSGP